MKLSYVDLDTDTLPAVCSNLVVSPSVEGSCDKTEQEAISAA